MAKYYVNNNAQSNGDHEVPKKVVLIWLKLLVKPIWVNLLRVMEQL